MPHVSFMHLLKIGRFHGIHIDHARVYLQPLKFLFNFLLQVSVNQILILRVYPVFFYLATSNFFYQYAENALRLRLPQRVPQSRALYRFLF